MKRTHASRFARLTALLLTLCLLAGMMPAAVFAEETDLFIFGYKSSAQIIGVSTTNQSDYTEIADYDDSLLGLEIIDDTIYGLSCDHSFLMSELVILNPDFTVQQTVGSWVNFDFVITDTAVQNGTLWGTYNDADFKSYLIPINLTNGIPEYDQKREITGLTKNEIVYTIACNKSGQMYAIVADGGENGGAATLYTIDTSTGAATRVGSTGVTTNFISSSAFAPDGTLYWAENNASKLYKVNTSSGKVTAVPGGTIGGKEYVLNAMMIPSNSNVAYVNFIVNGNGKIMVENKKVSGWTEVAQGDLSLTFSPDDNNKVKEVVVDGEEMGSIGSYNLQDVKAWSAGTHTVEVTFQSKDIKIKDLQQDLPYLGRHTFSYHPSYEAKFYFKVINGPARYTEDAPYNYEIFFEKNGERIEKKDLVPGIYDIHVKREADDDWNALDNVLEDGLTISKQTSFPLWHDLEMTANPGDTLADIEKPTYLVSSLDGKQIPGTFRWVDDENTSVGELGESTQFKFRFVPDPLSDDLAALYDFSPSLLENGYEGKSNVKVVEEGSTVIEPIPLPVRTLEEGATEYVPASGLSAKFVPDVEVSAGEFGDNDGLRIDYYNPMENTEAYGSVSKGYDIQVEYNLSIPLESFEGSTLKGMLTVPLPSGYDGKSARLKESGTKASSYTKTTVSFPVTLHVEGNTASLWGLLIEYREAKSGSHTSHSGSSSGSSASPLPLAPGATYQPPEPGEPAQPGESGEPAQSGGNPGSFRSDTTSDFTVSGPYQFRITSLDGTVPVMTVENASFRVEFASQEGNDYFFRIVPQGAAGSTAKISVNGASLLTATVGGSASGVISDTTHPFTVAQGGTYQFRLTASARPDFAAGSPSFAVEYAGRIGSDYFFKVHAVGQPGDGCGFYVNGEASPVAVATIA